MTSHLSKKLFFELSLGYTFLHCSVCMKSKKDFRLGSFDILQFQQELFPRCHGTSSFTRLYTKVVAQKYESKILNQVGIKMCKRKSFYCLFLHHQLIAQLRFQSSLTLVESSRGVRFQVHSESFTGSEESSTNVEGN